MAEGAPPPLARSALRASTCLGEAGARRDGWGHHIAESLQKIWQLLLKPLGSPDVHGDGAGSTPYG